MEAWKVKTIVDSYNKTKEYRFNNYVVNPHIKNSIGIVPGKSLLEVGCGFGRYLEIFAQENPVKLVGCDISAHQLALCKEYIKHTKNDNIALHLVDFSNPEASVILGHHEYDIVYSVFVILYLESLEKLTIFMRNCYQCLKDSGKVIICTLDILSATAYPEIFNILQFPVRPLKDDKYDDGYPIEIQITNDCIVTSYQKNFQTLKHIMEKVGFKNVKRSKLFLDQIALRAFASEELSMIKKSNILLLIEAEK